VVSAATKKGTASGKTPAKLRRLLEAIRRGEVDTVLVVFPDMHGRWMGKRVTGRFFAEEAASQGVHACNYLLTTDMEMEPVQGYAYASWEKGYGDFRLVPDWASVRRLPWLEKAASLRRDEKKYSDEYIYFDKELVDVLIMNATALEGIGRIEDAKVKLRAAIEENPLNQIARHKLRLLQISG